ncbi:MAG: hypothetical protein IJ125_00870 [Atopobiaceae bacterium]|nr:hypothetical protein [Atopobiaceae bacterium]
MVQISWGFIQSLIGFTIFVGNIRSPHTLFHGALVTEWKHSSGVSLGLFVFVPQGCPRRLVVHEYGHCVQSLVLGPLYVVAIMLPSMLWAGLPQMKKRRASKDVSYYSLYTEKSADWLGVQVCGEDAMARRFMVSTQGCKDENMTTFADKSV